MEINWQSEARQDLKNYFKNTKTMHPEKYISDLVKFVKNLKISPNLGLSYIDLYGFEIRELIFKQHKIFYYIKNEKIIILHVIHSSRDSKNILKIIKRYFNEKN